MSDAPAPFNPFPASPAAVRHAEVVSLHLQGQSQPAIARAVGYSQATVCRIIQGYEAQMLRTLVPGADRLSAPELTATSRVLAILSGVNTDAGKRAVLTAVLAALDAELGGA
jgi:transposase